MFERSEPVLRIVCVGLAAVLVFQVGRVLVRHNPVGRMSIPALPTLPTSTNTAAGVNGTNAAPIRAAVKKESNSVAETSAGKPGTNLIAREVAGKKEKDTNAAPMTGLEKLETNAVASARKEKKNTNVISSQDFGKMETNSVVGVAALKNRTNATNRTNGTNGTAAHVSARERTNSVPGMAAMGRRRGGFGPGQMGSEKLPKLPPLIQARIDKIVESEIMAQLTKAQPTGLIGIAGNGAMLRTASGQTGYVKEGGELGGIKLLSVGINRVLVEEEGQKKELMIFSGMGGETLLPKHEETNETITKIP